LAKFGWVPFAVCNAWQRNRTQNLRRVGIISCLFYAVCGPKSTKFSDDVGDLLYFTTPLSDYLCLISLGRYSSLSLEVVENPASVKVFSAPIFLGGMTRLVYRKLLARFIGKVWLSSVCWSICEAWQWSKMQNLRRVAKNAGPTLSRLWTKVYDMWRWCRRPLVVSNALTRLCRPISRFVWKI